MSILKEFSFPSTADGLEIAGICVVPEIEFIGIVQLVHGMAEHKERYITFMKALADHGYLCILHDHRGHGKSVKSKEDLGYFYGKKATFLIDDIHQLTMYIKKEYPELPLTLFGHSMGSLLVRAYCKRYDDDIDALLVCGSPSKNSAAGMGRTLVHIMEKFKGERYRSKLIQRMAFGSNNKKFSEQHSENVWLCSDMNVVAEYDRDPLCGFTFTLNGFDNLFYLMQDVYHKDAWKCSNTTLPILFIAGELDPCILNKDKFKEAYTFMKELGYTSVSAHLFEGKRHEILNESMKEEVYEYIISWLKDELFVKNEENS